MSTVRDADHAMGLELQLEELVEQRARADAQGRLADADRLDGQIARLQAELAATAETHSAGRRPVIHAPQAAEVWPRSA